MEHWNGLIDGEISQKPVCFDVTIQTKSQSFITWKLGTCFGSLEYQDESRYIYRCCLLPGKYILECRNEKTAVGWCNGFIEFQGQRYCEYILIRDARH